MKGNLKVIEGVFPITLSEGVYINQSKTLADYIREQESSSGNNSTIQSNLKANFMGDSITAGSTSKLYLQYIKEEIGLIEARNYGISGSTISKSNNPMSTRVNNMNDDADLIFVFGGTNDFHFNVPMGDFYNVSGNTRTFNTDNSTFKGSLVLLCKNLISKYPNKQIFLMTPIHRSNFGGQLTDLQYNNEKLYVEDYVQAIKDVGKIFSIPVIDLYSESGLVPSENANASIYFPSNDKLHPNYLGHEKIAKCILRTIKQYI